MTKPKQSTPRTQQPKNDSYNDYVSVDVAAEPVGLFDRLSESAEDRVESSK